MSSSPANSGTSTPNPGVTSAQEQQKILEEALNVVKVQSFHMKRCLDNTKLMDALKHCSTLLAELKTSSLTPKNYYELYMAIFDELQHLTTFLYDAHMSKRHHLSDLYELVQYAGNIVPRLYLMITVGSVYMRVSREQVVQKKDSALKVGEPTPAPAPVSVDGALVDDVVEGEGAEAAEEEDVPPIKELMKDMLEMSRGVQHPTRGLFLRYYLSGMTRDYLPDGIIDGPHGTINDSIQFILQNFVEMNKLWVRLQFQGHSKEREKREKERKELRLLVGANLVRLSQLEGLDLEIFRGVVLPKILDEIVSCRDIIAQEYLMEVIIQVFQDDFHLRTLDSFLSATARLHRNVNVKQTVISLIDRFAAFAARARDEAEPQAKGMDGTVTSPTGIPEDVPLFEVFWTQVTELIQARPEFTVEDVVSLLVSLINLSLNCYPDRLDHIDQILGFAKEKYLEAISLKSPELHTAQTVSSLLQLLLAPVNAYNQNPLALLAFPSSSTQQVSPIQETVVHEDVGGWGSQYIQKQEPKITSPTLTTQSLCGNYTDLLFLQPFTTRRQVAHAIANACLRASVLPIGAPTGADAPKPFRISSVDGVDAIFGELCSVMVRDQKDGGLFGPRKSAFTGEGEETLNGKGGDEELPLDWEDIVEEQNMVAKLVHLLKAKDSDPEQEFVLLAAARKHFGEGGDIRIRFTLVPLVMNSVQLGPRYMRKGSYDIKERLVTLYKFIHQTVLSLSRAQEYFADDDYDSGPLFRDDPVAIGSVASKIGKGLLPPPDIALRLFLMAAKAANDTGHEELSYEFFVQALTMYEESISESKAQMAAITLIIGTLYTTSIFGYENYETLITKCTVHCSRLLKRVDQCRGITIASHLFWASVGAAEEGESEELAIRKLKDQGKVVYRDGKKVLESLQKALKIADSVMDQSLNVELFVEILEKYIWYFEKRNETITVKYLNSLIDLIQTNLANIDASTAVPPSTLSHYHSGGRASLFTGASDLPGSISGTRRVPDTVVRHFSNILGHLRAKRDEEAGRSGAVPGLAGGFGDGHGGLWGGIELGRSL
ncbi:Vacuolar protein sorting-associated protein 35 [Phlyctochytrium planicorne]|nr:Vacuolar protein sorting-associated protein 35 [Phlyctochytrium planicorne]